jgi:hypothetical protein
LLLAQPVGRLDEILDVGAEIGVGELAFAGAPAGEIEAQRRNTELAQTIGDSRRSKNVLGAREAVGKQRDGLRLSARARSRRAASLWP